MSDIAWPEPNALVERIQEAVSSRMPYIRAGQHAMNTLSELEPDLASRVRRSHEDINPFDDDNRLPAFYRFIEMNTD